MPNGRQQAKKGVTAPPVLFIVGPTAVGKSRLAVALARRFNGEIVNADSRQVYRHMDIGTAKPLAEQRTQAPHHLLEMLNPDQDFGLASFLSLAEGSIRDIHGRGHLPIVTGGTGQYIWALVEGWQVPQCLPTQFSGKKCSGRRSNTARRLSTSSYKKLILSVRPNWTPATFAA